MLKLTGCMLIILSGTLFGYFRAAILEEKLKNTRMIFQMISNIKIMLSSEYMSTREIVQHLNLDKRFNRADFIKMPLEEDISKSLSENVKKTSLNIPQNLKEELSCYFFDFGSTDMDGQIAKVNVFLNQVKEILDETEKNVRSKAMLYRKLAILASIAVVILLI